MQANINANPPPRPSSSRSVSPNVRRRPPLPLPVAATPASTYLRRAGALTPDDNYEIAAYLQRSPSSPPSLGSYRHAAGRAVSLPPASLQQSLRPSVPRWFPTSTTYYGRATSGGSVPPLPSRTVYRGSSGAVPLPVGLPPNVPSGERLDAITDSVVGVARTSLYGDIVIGIPYKKRYMYNVQVNKKSICYIQLSSGAETVTHRMKTACIERCCDVSFRWVLTQLLLSCFDLIAR